MTAHMKSCCQNTVARQIGVKVRKGFEFGKQTPRHREKEIQMKETLPPDIRIDEYAAGRHMMVGGRKYTHDLKIIGNSVKGEWWRREGHRLAAADIADILADSPALLVVGTGYAGGMRIPDALRRHLETKHIGLVTAPTAEAVQTFNRMRAEGKNVAGAFHLTC